MGRLRFGDKENIVVYVTMKQQKKLILFLTFLSCGNSLSASASRSFISRAIAPIKAFTSTHPRLTKTVGVGAAVVGAYALYKWWKSKRRFDTHLGQQRLQQIVGDDHTKRHQEIAEALYGAAPQMPYEIIAIIRSYVDYTFEGTCTSRIEDTSLGLVEKIIPVPQNPRLFVSVNSARSSSLSLPETGSLKIWDLKTKSCVKSLPVNEIIVGLDFLDGHLVTALANGSIIFWDIESGQRLKTVRQAETITAFTVVHHGVPVGVQGYLAIGCKSGFVKLLDVDGNLIRSWEEDPWMYQPRVPPFGEPVTALAESPQGLICASARGQISVRSVLDGSLLQIIERGGGFFITEARTVLRMLPGGRLVYGQVPQEPVLRNEGMLNSFFKIIVFDLLNQRQIKVLGEHRCVDSRFKHYPCGVIEIALLPNGTLASLVESDSETVKIWDLESGNCLKTVSLQSPCEAASASLAVLSNGVVVVGGENKISFLV
jgi:WD40 repeat protein